MDVIPVIRSTGEVLSFGNGNAYGTNRPNDSVPLRSNVPVRVRFLSDDRLTRVTLQPATGSLSFAALPAAGDTFTVGPTTYTAVSALTGAANEVLLGADVAAFANNLAAAINTAAGGATVSYGAGTLRNPVATAAVTMQGTNVATLRFVLTARYADASGNAVATTSTGTYATFSGPTLSGGDVLDLHTKPPGKYDQIDFTLPPPAFKAPLDPTTGDYVAYLDTTGDAALKLLDPNNQDGTHPDATEPDSAALMVQLAWGVPGAYPARSDKWQFNLTNVVGHEGTGIPTGGLPPLTFEQVRVATYQAGRAEAYSYADYPKMVAGEVDSRVAGVAPTADNQPFFSTYNTAAGTFVRNERALFRWPAWASVWNSANADGTGGNRGCIVLVTPTEGLTNHHFAQVYQPGVTHTFLGTDGKPYVLTVASSQQDAATDLQVVKFTTAAPAAVPVAPVLTPAQAALLLRQGAPLIASAQDHLARVFEIASHVGDNLGIGPALASGRGPWTRNPPANVGDSDQPLWMILNGVPVFIAGWSSGGAIESVADNLDALNALLTGGTLRTMALNLLPTPPADAQSIRGVAVATDAPTDGDALTYDAASNRYKPKAPAAGASNGTAFVTPAAAAAYTLDFATGPNFVVLVYGSPTFTTTNLANGRKLMLVLKSDYNQRTVTFPDGWTFVGNPRPTAVAAFKTAVLRLSSTGTTDAGVVAEYAVQP